MPRPILLVRVPGASDKTVERIKGQIEEKVGNEYIVVVSADNGFKLEVHGVGPVPFIPKEAIWLID